MKDGIEHNSIKRVILQGIKHDNKKEIRTSTKLSDLVRIFTSRVKTIHGGQDTSLGLSRYNNWHVSRESSFIWGRLLMFCLIHSSDCQADWLWSIHFCIIIQYGFRYCNLNTGMVIRAMLVLESCVCFERLNRDVITDIRITSQNSILLYPTRILLVFH